MMFDALPALLTFALVASATPGPNNMMLLASGANFGFRRTLPHLLGVNLGFVVMVGLVGLGLMGIFEAWPPARTVLRVLATAYLGWLAWRVATADAPTEKTATRPLSFLEAAAFQWVNPKAWAMALTAISVYAPDRTAASVLWVALAFGVVNLPSISLWTAMGTALTQLVATPRRRRAFNWTMAGLLVASSLPMLA